MSCQATTKAGDRCKAPALQGDTFCFHHSPDRAAERAAARRRGGLRLHHGDGGGERPDVSIRDVRDIVRLLETAAGDVLARKPSVQRARALVYISTTALKALEAANLEERITALERRMSMETA